MNSIITKLENFQKFNSFPFHIDIISPTETIPFHYHNCVEMIFVKTGSAINCIDSTPFNYHRRHLFLASGQVSHAMFDFENFSAYRLLFDMSIFDDFDEELKKSNAFVSLFVMSNLGPVNINYRSSMTVREAYTPRLFSILDELLHSYETAKFPKKSIKLLFYEAVELLLQQFNNISKSRNYGHPQLFQTLLESINEPLSIPELADKFQISTIYLYKLFKKRFGKSPKQIIKDLRIRNAKMLLALTDKSITEIAAACGFSNPVYFAEVFKSYVGISPTQYRKNTKKGDA